MPKTIRERAFWNGELVTVLEKKRTKARIRDQRGFVHEVAKRDLDKIPEGDPLSKFQFGED